MSVFSQIRKGVVQDPKLAASTGLLFRLPATEVGDPEPIALREWLALPIDDRAPVRSVAMVEVTSDGFRALVIDTVAGRLRWRISVPRDLLASLYAGMLGDAAAGSRGTMVVSAPLAPAARASEEEGEAPPPEEVPGATPSKPGGPGAGGDCVPPGRTSVILAQIVASFQAAQLVQIGVRRNREAPVRYYALLIRPGVRLALAESTPSFLDGPDEDPPCSRWP